MLHVSAKHKIVGVPYIEAIRNLYPDAETVTHAGNNILLLPHNTASTMLLRKLELDCPSPIISQYDWEGGTPYDVQRRTAEMLTLNKHAYVLNGMGTGKTKSALWAWRWNRRNGLAKKLLVIAPLSTLNFTWAREIFNTLPGIKCAVLTGTRGRRLQRLADPEPEVYIINHDGIKILEEDLIKRDDIDTVVYDELAVFRNPTAERTKCARRIAARMEWVWGMTGSPTPQSPVDAWGQASIITPETSPKHFTRFRDEVMIKINQFKFVPKKDALDRVFKLMQPAVRYTLDDVLELPELIERTIDVEMGKVQAKVYTAMEKEAYVQVKSSEITAMNAGAVLNKLLQISTGWVYTRDGSTVPLDNDIRLDTLVDLIEASDRKVIVFVPFKHAVAGIAEKLTRVGIEHRVVTGDTPHGQRSEIFKLFQTTGELKALVAHPQCMAHGLTLTAADTIIWFAPITSLEIFEQANARIRRIGQKHKQQVLMMQATKAERHIYTKLRQKQGVQNALLTMFEDGTEATPL